MFESIYLDYTGEVPPLSHYAVLAYQLRIAERAKKIHEEMHARVLAKHTARVAAARAALESEVERLKRDVI